MRNSTGHDWIRHDMGQIVWICFKCDHRIYGNEVEPPCDFLVSIKTIVLLEYGYVHKFKHVTCEEYLVHRLLGQ